MTRQNHLTSQETNPAAISIPRLRATLNGRVTTPGDQIYPLADAALPGRAVRFLVEASGAEMRLRVGERRY